MVTTMVKETNNVYATIPSRIYTTHVEPAEETTCSRVVQRGAQNVQSLDSLCLRLRRAPTLHHPLEDVETAVNSTQVLLSLIL